MCLGLFPVCGLSAQPPIAYVEIIDWQIIFWSFTLCMWIQAPAPTQLILTQPLSIKMSLSIMVPPLHWAGVTATSGVGVVATMTGVVATWVVTTLTGVVTTLTEVVATLTGIVASLTGVILSDSSPSYVGMDPPFVHLGKHCSTESTVEDLLAWSSWVLACSVVCTGVALWASSAYIGTSWGGGLCVVRAILAGVNYPHQHGIIAYTWKMLDLITIRAENKNWT